MLMGMVLLGKRYKTIKYVSVVMITFGIATCTVMSALGIAVPVMVLHLLCNVVLQYLCISAVFVLTSECTSLTASLVLTFRKFLSLLFSIWYFQNPFTLQHWIGTCFVFCGIILFTDIPGYLSQRRLANVREKAD